VVSVQAWIEAVRKCVGTPYVHQGRAVGVGMDCPGPLILPARETGIKPPDFDVHGYNADPDGKSLRKYLDEHLTPEIGPLQAGRVVLCAWSRERMRPRHLGVITEAAPRLMWVHADGYRHKKVIETRLVFGVDGMHLVQAYSVPGVAWHS
jgi:cell wall-associated NlpC family hydrolase